MQTFLPHASFVESARCLDRKRLAGQRKEGVQLLYAIDPTIRVGTPELIARKDAALARGEVPKRGWGNHAAAKMWSGRSWALLFYLHEIDAEWVRRGYKSGLLVRVAGYDVPIAELQGHAELPSWIGDERVHSSHRSALLRKLPDHYGQFGWTEGPDLPYYWPGPCARLEVAAGACPG